MWWLKKCLLFSFLVYSEANSSSSSASCKPQDPCHTNSINCGPKTHLEFLLLPVAGILVLLSVGLGIALCIYISKYKQLQQESQAQSHTEEDTQEEQQEKEEKSDGSQSEGNPREDSQGRMVEKVVIDERGGRQYDNYQTYSSSSEHKRAMAEEEKNSMRTAVNETDSQNHDT